MRPLLLAAVAGVAGATLMAQGQQPRFESRLDLVVVSAIVRDQQNAMVRGLGQADFKLFWQESGTYYLLGYELPRRDGRMHTIDVRVKRPGLQVRARRTRG